MESMSKVFQFFYLIAKFLNLPTLVPVKVRIRNRRSGYRRRY